MKKILLSFSLIASIFGAYSQVAVVGVSPAAVVGSYDFGLQANAAGWPGQTDDGTWGLTTDFNIPGTYVQGDLMVADDGTAGVSAQGISLANYGCVPLTNDLTGKIALVYRYDGVTASTNCNFATKILNCQNAGAIAVIIVNRVPGVMGMLGIAPEGLSVTIPAVIISDTDGALLRAAMQTGPVNMFIGDKFGAFADDAGAKISSTLVSKSTGVISQLATNATEFNFELGTRIFNYGTNNQSNVSVTANINGPSGSSVYSNTVGPFSILSGDSVDIYPGDTYSFPQFSLASYPAGKYTLTYTIDLGISDNMAYDNVLTSEFIVNDSIYSFARLDGTSHLPISNNGYRPSANTSTYATCMVIDNPNASRIGIEGIYFQASTSAASGVLLTGEEIALSIYRWEDVFVDFNDAGLAFNTLNQVGFGFYYYPSDLQSTVVYGALSTPVVLEDNQRFLACIQTVNLEVFLGHDTKMDYTWNENTYLQPLFPVESDGTYSAGGFGSDTPNSMALKIFSPSGIEESATIEGIAYPNPATNVVTVSLKAEGTATLSVTDISGRIAMSNTINLVNGKSEVAISSLDAGVYVFTITLENGQTSQFNVVKK